MPYFKKINTLLIHIPKTGGTSVENYFYNRYDIKRTLSTLYSSLTYRINNHSFQHSTFQELYENRKYLEIDFDNLKILSIVRNPYERIISDLFFFKLINLEMTQEQIFDKIKYFLETDDCRYDNHKIELYKYLINNKNIIDKNITILKTENLTNGMKSQGYEDFDLEDNKTHRNKINYIELLNENSINLINKFYKKDFEYFNYNMI
tara:strand:+ start:685 stop:1302 length:618 start_codon:yes stop_codon:yes gene_type:complete